MVDSESNKDEPFSLLTSKESFFFSTLINMYSHGCDLLRPTNALCDYISTHQARPTRERQMEKKGEQYESVIQWRISSFIRLDILSGLSIIFPSTPTRRTHRRYDNINISTNNLKRALATLAAVGNKSEKHRTSQSLEITRAILLKRNLRWREK